MPNLKVCGTWHKQKIIMLNKEGLQVDGVLDCYVRITDIGISNKVLFQKVITDGKDDYRLSRYDAYLDTIIYEWFEP